MPVDRRSFRQLTELVAHLAKRQLESQHRFTVLGWTWPLLRQLVQLVVLVFVFSGLLDLGIPNFPLFVFVGLMIWTWFATAVTVASSVLVNQRHMLMSPGFPAIALPLVAVAVPLVDLLMALPVLLILLAVSGEIHAGLLALPLVVLVEFALAAGVALIVSVLNVYVRDVENVVTVGLLLLFYLTPVFYGLRQVPERFHGVLGFNPVGRLVTIARDLVIEGRAPGLSACVYVLLVAGVLLTVGVWLFRRLQADMLDLL
jgi:lipopolysaccharide transport system permease protein